MDERLEQSDRIERRYVRRIRWAFQWALFALVVYGGWQFWLFTRHFTAGTLQVERPPLVDGFLPIGALMSMKLWLVAHIFDPVHPSGLVIFSSALVMSLALKKSFCGWVCPVGALSEQLHRLGAKLFGRNLRIHRYIDYPLRALKYLLLAFFFSVVLRMPVQAIMGFMHTPYWKVADVKMLRFFADMSTLTAVVLGVLVVLSLVFRNFWCRYLCPYGALTGLLSYLSPAKVTRSEEHCIHCHACSRDCPQLIDVENLRRVRSPECTGCLTCVSRCPARGALDMTLPRRKVLHPVVFAVLVGVLFFGLIGAAKLTGHWRSNVTYQEYYQLVPLAGKFDHP